MEYLKYCISSFELVEVINHEICIDFFIRQKSFYYKTRIRYNNRGKVLLTCTCKSDNTACCRHLYYVLLNVLKLKHSMWIHQLSLSEILLTLEIQKVSNIQYTQKIVSTETCPQTDMCIICWEDLSEDCNMKCNSCHIQMHYHCFEQWREFAIDKTKCIHCLQCTTGRKTSLFGIIQQ